MAAPTPRTSMRTPTGPRPGAAAFNGPSPAPGGGGGDSMRAPSIGKSPMPQGQTPRTGAAPQQTGQTGHRRLFSRNTLGNFQKAQRMEQLGQQEDGAAFMKTNSKPDPQWKMQLPSALIIRVVIVLNVVFSVIYLYWRVSRTITIIDKHFFNIQYLPVVYWAWCFYFVEVFLVIAIWIGHTQRMFPVQRAKVTMDDLVNEDDSVGYNARVAILLPTAGESLNIVLKAILGCVSQRTWVSGLSRSKTLRLVILDEKRRKGVLNMAAASYALATMVQHPNILAILQAEGVQATTAKGFYDWWKDDGGYARKHLYNDHYLNQACRLLEYVEEATHFEDDSAKVFSLETVPEHIKVQHEAARRSKATTMASVQAMLTAMNLGTNAKIEPGFVHIIDTNPNLPTVIYYTRRDANTPPISPKAGNMNSAIFSVDYPDQPPLVGDATIIVVNDCRHQLLPEFLQRTVPYFFELDETSSHYKWAKVAFVQTPQRFPMLDNLKDDPLGNHAAIHYDIVNHGKDGIGAVSSSGQGSLWRVEALRGAAADGSRYAAATDRSAVGSKLGFRAQMLIEDTHTSIDIFRHGWVSRYVNEPDEHLSVCTHQPNSIQWRIKQVLRWHQGAVQLLFYKGIWYTSFGGKFPTFWHRVYAFDQATYYLQAFPGYMLLLMPIIYGVTGQPPFDTQVGTFFLFFTPFIVTAMLPNVISGTWKKIPSEKLTRDEQVWLSTTYVQCYAFLSMLWSHVQCKTESAWSVAAPTWPLFVVFAGEIAAIIGSVVWVSYYSFEVWAANMLSVMVSAMLALHALWPMVSVQMGWKMPSMYYVKILTWMFLGTFIVLVSYVG